MMSLFGVSPAARRWLRAGFTVGVMLLVGHFVIVVPAVRDRLGAGWWGNEPVDASLYLLAAGLVLARAVLVRQDRAAWALMGTGLLAYAIGTLCWVVVAHQDPVPYPSAADWFWLAFYPFVYAAVLRLLRVRVSRTVASTWLDGLIASACAAAVAGLVFLPALSGDAGGVSGWAAVVSVAYPTADIVLAAGLLGAWALSGWRTERLWMMLLAALAVNLSADGLHMVQTLDGTYVPGTLIDALWLLALAGVVAAAWQGEPPARVSGPARAWVAVSLPALPACASVALLVYGSWGNPVLPRLSSVLAAVAITAAVVRMLLTVRAVEGLADARRQARTDDLTGLPNRRLFVEILDEKLRDRAPAAPLAVALVDLDRFKEINDSFGHHIGDRLLQMVGARLAAVVGESGVLARTGGDEFGLILPAADVDHARALVADLLATLRHHPFDLEHAVLHVDASIGIAAFPEHGHDRATLLRHADTAMYNAKANHTGLAVATGDPDDDLSRRRLITLEELRAGLERGQLTLHYQPQVDLASGRVLGVEALVRWNHPTRGLVYPDGFLAIAESAGLMGRLTMQVIDLALRQCHAWRAQGVEVPVAVNLSSSNLQDTDLPARIAETLHRHRLPATALQLEVTEEVLMRDADRATEVLTALRAMGIRLAVDDYGTGYSSLTYLHALPVDDLKLDRAFVTHCDSDPRSAAIVASTVDLAHNLGMRMVAEGVENQAVLERLRHWGCDLAQGYYLARPQSAQQLTPWLREQMASGHHAGGHAVRSAAS
jgi:diguanylate cyclase (GGDEF)-like protein